MFFLGDQKCYSQIFWSIGSFFHRLRQFPESRLIFLGYFVISPSLASTSKPAKNFSKSGQISNVCEIFGICQLALLGSSQNFPVRDFLEICNVFLGRPKITRADFLVVIFKFFGLRWDLHKYFLNFRFSAATVNFVNLFLLWDSQVRFYCTGPDFSFLRCAFLDSGQIFLVNFSKSGLKLCGWRLFSFLFSVRGEFWVRWGFRASGHGFWFVWWWTMIFHGSGKNLKAWKEFLFTDESFWRLPDLTVGWYIFSDKRW